MALLASRSLAPWSGCTLRNISRKREVTSFLLGFNVPGGKLKISKAQARGSEIAEIDDALLPAKYAMNDAPNGPRQVIARRIIGPSARRVSASNRSRA